MGSYGYKNILHLATFLLIYSPYKMTQMPNMRKTEGFRSLDGFKDLYVCDNSLFTLGSIN